MKPLKALFTFLVVAISFMGIGQTTLDPVQNSIEVVDQDLSMVDAVVTTEIQGVLSIYESNSVLDSSEWNSTNLVYTLNEEYLINENSLGSLNVITPLEGPKINYNTQSDFQKLPINNYRRARDGLSEL